MPKKPKVAVTPERIAELVAMLQIPETIKPSQYPFAMLLGRENIFIDICAAAKSWKKVDREVSDRIFPVINANCQSSDEVDALLNAITA